MEPSDAGNNGPLLMPYSCYACRTRKLKCNRLKPACTRCVSAGEKCAYPTSRKRQVITATKPKIQALESRLMDLEHRLNTQSSSQPAESQSSKSPASSLEEELIGTGRFEQLPPQAMVEELTNLYFKSLHPETPMLHKSRYISSLYLPPHMQPPMCLQYAVMAMGASISPIYSHLAQAFYRRARSYLEADEMRGEGQDYITLAHCQCWILIGHFEVQNLWFSRSATSASRGIRLAQILGIDRIDGGGGLGPTLPPPRDWVEQEERRRTMWTVFCNDRNTSATTNWPCLLDQKRIHTNLPVSEEAFQSGVEGEHSITLTEALNSTGNVVLSAHAFRVLSSHLFFECLDHTYRDQHEPNPSIIEGSDFWRRHYDLNNDLASAFILLPDGLRCPANVSNHDAVFVNFQLHTAAICLQRIGAARVKKYNLDPALLSGTQARLLPAAQEIFNIVAALGNINAIFKNPFVAFAAYMAAYAFLEDYLETQNRQSEEKMESLLNLMIVIGHQNPVTASLSVQMAHELKRTGVDASAVDKVADLMQDLAKSATFMGKQNASSGGVTFCPFEVPSDKVPAGAPLAYPGFIPT